MQQLRPMSEAKKNGTNIWAVIRPDLSKHLGREELKIWDGVQIPIRHPGLADDGFDMGWNVAAPVGSGGFPDDWFLGWVPLLEIVG